jgi:hypothetical protein
MSQKTTLYGATFTYGIRKLELTAANEEWLHWALDVLEREARLEAEREYRKRGAQNARERRARAKARGEQR